jgi:hypothetical protein
MSKIFTPIKTRVEITKTTLLFQEVSSPDTIVATKNNINEEWNTSKFNKAKIILNDTENGTKQIEAQGDFYTIANLKEETDILDENGELFASESLFISGLRHQNFHKIANNGKLILYIKNPSRLTDIHMVIMEFKGEYKDLQTLINNANEKSNFSLFLQKTGY